MMRLIALPCLLVASLIPVCANEDVADLSFELPLSARFANTQLTAEELTRIGSDELSQGGRRAWDAVQAFMVALGRSTDSPTAAENLAVALASGSGNRKALIGLIILCEARAAAKLAQRLGSDATRSAEISSLLDDMERNLAQAFIKQQETAKSCSEIPSGTDTEDAAMALQDAGRHVEAVQLLCTPEALQVKISNIERKNGILNPATLYRIWVLRSVCGVIHLENVLEADTVEQLSDAQRQHWERNQDIQQMSNAKTDTAAVRGDRKRFEMVLDATHPFSDPALTSSPFLWAVCQMVLGSMDFELDTFSYVLSLVGSRQQPWHADVHELFPSTAREQSQPSFGVPNSLTALPQQIPSFGLVSIVPLTDLTPENGATEFLMGSHVDMGAGLYFWRGPTEGGINNVTPAFPVRARKGSVVMFDLRVRHRGEANRSAKDRAVLYMSYVRPWFSDTINFKRPQGKAWDDLATPRMQQLFSRVESRAFTKLLERELEKRGVDVAALASGGTGMGDREL